MDILRERDVEFDVINYIKQPLSEATLRAFVAMVEEPPAELVRKDRNFKDLGLDAGDYTTEDAVVALLLQHPRLMQRPVVVRGDSAVIARPSAKVEALL